MDTSQLEAKHLAKISLSDCYRFINWLSQGRRASSANRARKISALRGFFDYLTYKRQVLSHNPCENLERPKAVKRLPRHLSLEESQALLASAAQSDSKFSERDYAILTLFLNCGLRLSELCHIQMGDWRDRQLRVIGKGNKERTIYLNDACLDALQAYLPLRAKMPIHQADQKALFISRQGNQISTASVQRLIRKYIILAGLDPTRYTTHKLRHTAATLMYQYGQVDIRKLQHILGHTSVATTEIYTHLDPASLHEAADRHPLAQVKVKKLKKDASSSD